MNAFLISKLSVGHVLPNQWTVMAYAVSDRHAIVQASMSTGELDHLKISFATWTISNDDLRSTADGHYHETDMDASFADFKARVAAMYALS